ncbi:MAG: hypothetical protein J6Y99_07495 [Bacteroidales bacterium]|nr:hypothetical protein [Bacteroidales bacterium]
MPYLSFIHILAQSNHLPFLLIARFDDRRIFIHSQLAGGHSSFTLSLLIYCRRAALRMASFAQPWPANLVLAVPQHGLLFMPGNHVSN